MAQLPDRPADHDDRGARPVHAQLLVGSDADPARLRSLAPAPCVWLWHPGSSSLTYGDSLGLLHRSHRATDPIGDACGTEERLHSDRGSQRTSRYERGLETRPEECGLANRDDRRYRVRHAAGWYGHHRDDLCLARTWAPCGRRDLWPGLSGVQTIVLLVSVIFVTLNLLVDVLYHWIDPRIELA